MDIYLMSLDAQGRHWHEMPIPRRWHRCQAVTLGSDEGMNVRRCACGGISLDGSPWMERNTRKAK